MHRSTPSAVALLLAAGSLVAAPLAAVTPLPPPSVQVERVLDAFHRAAADADEERYFGLLADHAVFLGTDGGERWDKAAFRAFAHPHFAQGKGWTFTPRDRHVAFSADGRVAWFDEALDSASYGACRGSGVLERTGSTWKIAQYNLSIPIPNDLAKDLVARIRAAPAAQPAGAP
jgi:ketosteroid isomerase-like protein